MLRSEAGGLAGFYGTVADEVSHRGPGPLAPIPAPAMLVAAMPRHSPGEPGVNGPRAAGADTGTGVDVDVDVEEVIPPAHQLPHPHLLWVQEHLHHLGASTQTVSGPALRLAEVRQRPWWR